MKDEQKIETYAKTTKTTKDKPSKRGRGRAEDHGRGQEVPAAAQPRAVYTFAPSSPSSASPLRAGSRCVVPASAWSLLHMRCGLVHTSASCISRLSLALVWPLARMPSHRLPHPTVHTARSILGFRVPVRRGCLSIRLFELVWGV